MQPKDTRTKWEPHIGKFLLSFTAIEHFVTISIDLLSNKAVSKTARTLLFEKRTELLLELLENSRKISKENKDILFAQLKKALNLSRNVRNIVAHNHILMELYKSSNDGNIYESEYIISSRNRSKKLSLSNLISFARETENLAEEVSETYLALVKEHFARSNNAQQAFAADRKKTHPLKSSVRSLK
ncbi:MAG: hypothetical protein JXA50_02720 [Deltaproteobacteria bacterium]|nr:hypothetical protein [Deltaproteobacteria bacterium]